MKGCAHTDAYTRPRPKSEPHACAKCGTRKSTYWRRGADGRAECNKCALGFADSSKSKKYALLLLAVPVAIHCVRSPKKSRCLLSYCLSRVVADCRTSRHTRKRVSLERVSLKSAFPVRGTRYC